MNIVSKNKENIKKIQSLLKAKVDKQFIVRFEDPKNFHVTLFFIGEINEDKLQEIFSVLKIKLENKTGDLNFSSTEINAFPDLRKPKVLFLNCINTENKIFEIAETIKNILNDFGFIQNKNFHPHITLARVKGKVKLKDLTDIKINVNFAVTKISIMQSRITTTGAGHKEIFAINL